MLGSVAGGLPAVGQEFFKALDVVPWQAREELLQILEGVGVVAAGAFDQGEEGRSGMPALVAAGEEPVLSFMPRFA